MSKVIGIAADHAGFALKSEIKSYIAQAYPSYTIVDFGTDSESSVDYPDFIHPLCNALGKNEISEGIIICGSGNGVNITANKYNFVRSALCWLPEISALARQHNNANVIALPARFISVETAQEIVKNYFEATFEGGRHQNRVDKITACL